MKHIFYLIFICLNVTVAVGQTKPDKGDGSELYPYFIENTEHLRWISEGDGESSSSDRMKASYIMVNNIDLSASSTWNEGLGFTPIGATESTPFIGNFDGNGKRISNLFINNPTVRYQGLFGFIDDGNVHHLEVENATITGDRFCGVLSGKITNSSTVHDIIISGTVNGNRGVGGLSGEINFTSEVHHIISFASATVPNNEKNVGGIAGVIYNSSSISDTYATGEVSGDSNKGGITGAGHYASGNQLVKLNKVYWDTETTTQTSNELVDDALFGLETVDFASNEKFDWDFESTWNIKLNATYDNINQRPYLNWMGLKVVKLINYDTALGTITGDGYYAQGEEVTLKVEPAENVEFVHWLIGDEVYSTAKEITVTVTEDLYIQPVFEDQKFKITEVYTARGGVFTTEGEAVANIIYATQFDVVDLVVSPNKGYELKEVKVNGISLGMVEQFTLSEINEDKEIEVTFEPYQYAIPEGEGTEANPYKISSLEELRWLSQGDTTTTIDDKARFASYYLLVNDIDASSTVNWNNDKGFLPIGTESEPFTGTFLGSLNEINGLSIHREKQNYVALFGYLSGATITNLQLKKVAITGARYTASLAGKAVKSSQINTVISEGNVLGERHVGGVFGDLNDASVATFIISGVNTSVIATEKNVGGITGVMYNNAVLDFSYAYGSVSGDSNTGGLVGAGHNNPDNANVVTVSNSYWDKETTTQTVSAGSTEDFGMPTSLFSEISTFQNWDFESKWKMAQYDDYDVNTRPFFKAIGLLSVAILNTTPEYGKVEGEGAYPENSEVKLIANPVEGVDFKGWKSGDVILSEAKEYTFTLQENTIIEAVFEPIYYTVKEVPSARGSVLQEEIEMTIFDIKEFTILPNTGYEVIDVTLNGESIGRVPTIKLEKVATDTEIEVAYGPYQYTIPEGEGSAENPYRISTLEELRWLSQGDTTTGIGNGTRWSYHYELIENIDASATKVWNAGLGFSPIGDDAKNFKGVFNGNSNVITDLTINRPTQTNIGLFGYSSGAQISQIEIRNVAFIGLRNVGAVIGKADASTEVNNIIASGSVYGERGIGGLFGDINSESNGTYLISAVDVSVYEGEKNAGGLAGTMYNKVTISNAYAFGKVNASSNVGGLVGTGHFSNENNLSIITDSYWDTETTTQMTSAGVEDTFGLPSASFSDLENLGNWAGDDAWEITQNADYDELPRPYFKWMGQYTVNVNNATPELGTVEGAGSYPRNSEVTLKASPVEGANFIHWKNGDEVVSENKEYTLTLNNNKSFIAVFEPILYKVTAIYSPNGSVLSDTVWMDVTMDEEFEIMANRGYEVDEVLLNGVSIGRVPTVKIEQPTSDIEIEVLFKTYNYTIPQGEGTSGNPYKITSLEELRWYSQGDTTTGIGDGTRWSSYVLLMNDLDATATQEWNAGLGFLPIGNSDKNFTGSFEGNYKTIKNLYINRPILSNTGFIGYANGAEIRHLELENIQVTGLRNVGSVIGKADNSSKVTHLLVSGKVHGERGVGGLFGDFNSNSYGANLISGVDVSVYEGEKNIGGLSGTMYNKSSITHAIAFGEISGSSNVGGLAGTGHFSNENNLVTITDSYWDIETTGQTTSAGSEAVYGLPTVAFSDAQNFENWDFETTYEITQDDAYGTASRPFFKWLNQVSVIVLNENPIYGEIIGDGAYYIGSDVTLKAVPHTGTTFGHWKVNDEIVSEAKEYTFEVDEDVIVEAVFIPSIYQVDVLPSTQGVITPESVSMTYFDTQEFTITPNIGYEVEDIKINGQSLGSLPSFTLEKVEEDKQIEVLFKAFDYEIPQGDGSKENPYLISTLKELRWFAEGSASSEIDDKTRWNSYVELINNIEAEETKDWNAGLGFRPIGNSTNNFKGHFNGNGYKIKNLTIHRPKERNIGLIGFASSGATVENVQMLEVDFTGERFIGAIVGRTDSVLVSKISATGKVHGERFIGGLLGDLSKKSQLEKSISFVNASAVEGERNVGGLVGAIYNESIIDRCYAVGEVTGASSTGGLIGTGHTEGTVVSNSYWDLETTGQNSSHIQGSNGAITTGLFSNADTFEGWDFENEWTIAIENDYDMHPRPYFSGIEKRSVTASNNKPKWGTQEGSGRYAIGETVKLSALPNGGHFFIEWQLNGVYYSDSQNIKVEVGESDTEYVAIYGAEEHFIYVTQTANGTISPETSMVYHHDDITFTIIPDEGFDVDYLIVDNDTLEGAMTYTFEEVKQSYDFTAVFKVYEPQIFLIPALAGDNGSIEPQLAEVEEGMDFTFEIIPDSGYEVEQVFVDGDSVGAMTNFTFTDVWEHRTISAIFKKSTVTDIEDNQAHLKVYPNPFEDQITIELSKASNIKVVDLMGKVILQKELTQPKNRIALHGIPSGIYILLIDDLKHIKIKKR
ncbi:InlB B-repeat-containing protein [Flammeovirga aprica]|uniref:T9SS type A sorting domain-containing protein n=1 Tax=Flammeovirga aprica JL-4 TaxID=694437 RepID=A0A7X9RYI4_9BACT|nr:T9SS type A sorting domain-containing protein [Flammeovirga aprica]NME71015.1 T9SS type A sorting domain-containing protein [Flammeovirga aprica JL-4]